MDLATIDVPEDEARAKLAEYQEAAEPTAEDQAIAAGYRAAASGLRLISLRSAIRTAGLHDNGLPRIAVVRATARQCHVTWAGDDLLFTDGDLYEQRRAQNLGALVNSKTVRVPGIGRPQWSAGIQWSGTAVVPLVPPRCRPRWTPARGRPRRLSACHVLWEVDQWSQEPPRDPALLWHIRGDLWAVVAVWDLTELERHVLTQRA